MLASPVEIAAVLDSAALPPGQRDSDGSGDGSSARQSWGANKLPAHVAAAAAGSLSAYRVPKETLGRLRRVLGGFVGTHKFHNFTNKMKATDGAAQRFIISFDADEPFVREAEEGGADRGAEGVADGGEEGGAEGGAGGCEWVMLTVVGQSFLLHQIRYSGGQTTLLNYQRRPMAPRTNVSVGISKSSLPVTHHHPPSLGKWWPPR